MNKITLIFIIPVISFGISRFGFIQEIIKTEIWTILILFIAVATVSVFVLKLFMK